MALERRTQDRTANRFEGTAVGSRKALAPLILALALPLGCVQTPAEKAQADMEVFRREQTPEKLEARGRAFAAIGDTTRAEEYLAAAIEAGADAKEILPMLLQICIQGGRYRSAIQHAENHLRKHPHDVRTRFVLGTLHAALGESRQAHKALAMVVEARPDDSSAHYALAVLARDSENDLVLADRHFRAYLRLSPDGAHAEEARASLLKRVP